MNTLPNFEQIAVAVRLNAAVEAACAVGMNLPNPVRRMFLVGLHDTSQRIDFFDDRGLEFIQQLDALLYAEPIPTDIQKPFLDWCRALVCADDDTVNRLESELRALDAYDDAVEAITAAHSFKNTLMALMDRPAPLVH